MLRGAPVIALLVGTRCLAGDSGPLSAAGDPLYDDYPRFQRDIAAVCRALDLPDIDSKLPVEARQLVASHRALEDGHGGADAWRVLRSVDNMNPKDKWSVFLAAAEDANIGRCPLAEAGYRAELIALKKACVSLDAKSCQARADYLEKIRSWID